VGRNSCQMGNHHDCSIPMHMITIDFRVAGIYHRRQCTDGLGAHTALQMENHCYIPMHIETIYLL